MPWSVRIVLGLALCSACVPAAAGQEPPAKPKVKVELRWVEAKPIEGVTEEKGFKSSCDPDDVVYAHKKPALVLTKAEVAKVELTRHDWTKNGLGVQYTVKFHLTKEAREKLAATRDSNEMGLLTITVDGKNWGIRRYEKDKNKQFVTEAARAETFLPDVGFFSSEAEAQRLVDAFK